MRACRWKLVSQRGPLLRRTRNAGLTSKQSLNAPSARYAVYGDPFVLAFVREGGVYLPAPTLARSQSTELQMHHA